LVGPDASPEEIDRTRAAIREDPSRWIVQDVVDLSTQPVVVDGDLGPRHVDLRPFAFHDGTRVIVPAGGLTRVAFEEGERVVNSSNDGGAKATWVI
ncbi:circularly permuted type 2 ATP-grasp protein, partial [Nocardioides albidus]